MKTKLLIVVSTLLVALSLMAQTTTQSAPAATGDSAKTCACCNHDGAAGKATCCGDKQCAKDGSCCKQGKCCQGKDGKDCPMMSKSKDGKMSCCQGKDGKCPMMSKGEKSKSCCGGKCDRSQAGM